MNYYNYRLKQIEILLKAFNNEKTFQNEIDELKRERVEILEHINFLE